MDGTEQLTANALSPIIAGGLEARLAHSEADSMPPRPCVIGFFTKKWARGPPRARAERYAEMRLLAKEDVDPKRVMSELPPLIKNYLRLSGFVGDGAVIDHQFNTTDVSVIVKTDLITEKYVKRYEKEWRGNQISG